jgi:hypothetical protein
VPGASSMIQPSSQFRIESSYIGSVDLVSETSFVRNAVKVDHGTDPVGEHLGKLVRHSATLAMP